MIRPAAIFAWFTMLLAQAIAPAFKTAGLSVGNLIDYVDLLAGVSSHMLALVCSGLCIVLLIGVGRDTRVSLVARVLLVAQTTIVLVLAVPASRFRLSAFACLFLGLIACSATLIAAFEGLREARSRALGMIMGLMGLAGTTRIVSAGLVSIFSVAQATEFSPMSNALATASVFIHGLAVFIALAWLASRKRKTVSFSTMAALCFTMLIVWAARSGTQSNAPNLMVLAARFQDQLLPLPRSVFPRVVDGFVVILGPVAAFATLFARKQMVTVVGALVLTLVAGPTLDVPGRALIMILAALATSMAAHDDKGMWEALMGKRLEEPNDSSNLSQAQRSVEKV